MAGCIAAIVLLTGAPLTGSGGTSDAHAQSRPGEPGLLQMLFNRNNRQETTRQPRPRQAAPGQRTTTRAAPARRSSSGGVASAPATPRTEAVEKAENARIVLVVGDFVADGLARGLTDAFAASPNVVVERRVNGSSGFVRDDFYDWPGEIGAILEEVKPSVLVVHLGSNDRQPLRVDGATREVLSEQWRTEYQSRIDAFINAAGQAGVAMSEHLGRLGVPHLVLERDRIAERWRTERWDSLVDNGPAWHDRFPTQEFEDTDPEAFAAFIEENSDGA